MAETVILHSTPLKDLKEIISQVIREELKEKVTPPPPKQVEYLTRKEVCGLLKISPVTLNEWTKSGLLKGYRLNSRIRYKRAEIEKSLQEVDSLKYKRRRI